MPSFVERHGLRSAEAAREASELERRLESAAVDVVRFAWPDQHGLLRGKTLVAGEAASALAQGVNLTSTLIAKDTSHRSVFPVFSAGGGFPLEGFQGAADFTIVPDASTFKVLPWAPRTGWVLCDAFMSDGKPCPYATRRILQHAVDALREHGLEFVAGLEVEFHVFKRTDACMALEHSGQPGRPPEVELLSHGHQYLTELRYDRVDEVMELLRGQLLALGMPLRSLEIEFGPSQFELTFGPTVGVLPADTMVLLRNAIKQICHRAGYHATFMCRPRIPNVMSSGWHLHQSLRHSRDDANAFVPADPGSPLSETGMAWLAGLKEHACGAAVFASPSVNGYRRYRPNSLAPDRAAWARDNRGAMLRVLGGHGEAASRIENRAGEPTANPYLYLASQIFSGLDGVVRGLDPGPGADVPYETKAQPLPRTLADALHALKGDGYLVEAFGRNFVDYYCHIKQAEIDRFNLEVSEWEHREYFDLF
ncbi:MAG TPA: glutamine synthetase family protein [Ramlibacter sp.]|uniref:glutamine synthetase family protein n=1 Tax=Ramlibacter sp. TaxID=1917967 RepID=UPI002BCE2AF3|nr:glutamine synthetase family protein [Ramlibacter sp.]HVZ46613.1 glutamine synthetase family protein [Ramlibacter sp.]